MVIEPTTRDLLAVFFRHKRAFLLTNLLVLAIGITFLLMSNTLYRSDAQVVVRFGDNVVPDLSRNTQPIQIVPDERRNLVLANVEIIRSPQLAAQTLSHFGLDKVYPELAQKAANPEQAMELAVHQLQTDLMVDPGEKGNVIGISLLAHERHLAQDMVQYTIDEYKRRQASLYSDPEIGFQKTELDKAQANLTQAQADLEAFKRQNSVVDFDNEVANLLKQRSEMSQTLNATQARLIEADQRRTALEAQLKTVPATIAGAASGERYRGTDDAQTRLADLRLKQQQLLSTYKTDSPVVQQLQKTLNQAEDDYRRAEASSGSRAVPTPNPVFQTLQTDYMHALADVKAGTQSVQVVQRGVDAINQRLDDLNRGHEGLVDRVRAMQVAEDTYKALASHYNDSLVTSNLNKSDIYRATILSAPTLPFKPARPRVLLTTAATLLTGFLLSVFVVFVMEMMDSRFRTSLQVMTVLDIPVLATIGDSPRRNDYLRLT
jgi:succinoglycan biosynthesis transport protein ExoP